MVSAYLAGPMRGLPNFNYDTFDEYATRWRAAGHQVISPHEGFGGDQTLSFATYMRHDLGILIHGKAQGVAVLPGWQQSEGATIEVTVARALAMPVWDAREPLVLRSYEETIGEEAQRLVGGDRNLQYGSAYDDFTQIGKVWSGLLGVDIGPAQVALAMAGLKLAREAYKPKRDSRVDAIGYLLCLEQVRGQERAIADGWITG